MLNNKDESIKYFFNDLKEFLKNKNLFDLNNLNSDYYKIILSENKKNFEELLLLNKFKKNDINLILTSLYISSKLILPIKYFKFHELDDNNKLFILNIIDKNILNTLNRVLEKNLNLNFNINGFTHNEWFVKCAIKEYTVIPTFIKFQKKFIQVHDLDLNVNILIENIRKKDLRLKLINELDDFYKKKLENYKIDKLNDSMIISIKEKELFKNFNIMQYFIYRKIKKLTTSNLSFNIDKILYDKNILDKKNSIVLYYFIDYLKNKPITDIKIKKKVDEFISKLMIKNIENNMSEIKENKIIKKI